MARASPFVTLNPLTSVHALISFLTILREDNAIYRFIIETMGEKSDLFQFLCLFMQCSVHATLDDQGRRKKASEKSALFHRQSPFLSGTNGDMYRIAFVAPKNANLVKELETPNEENLLGLGAWV